MEEKEKRLYTMNHNLNNNLVYNKDENAEPESEEEKKKTAIANKNKLNPTTVLDKMEEMVNKTLQSKEGLFRSYLSKHIEFRRIPRIFFEISDGKGMKQEIARNENRHVNPEYDGKSDGDLRKEFMTQMAMHKSDENM